MARTKAKKDEKRAKLELRWALVRAAMYGEVGEVRKLVRGADQGILNEALHGATAQWQTIRKGDGQIKAARLLLAAGADPDCRGGWNSDTPLLGAAADGCAGLVEVMIEHGATLDVFAAAAIGDAARVRKLLKQDPQRAKAVDPAGLTALVCCARSKLGNSDPGKAKALAQVAQMLLDAGAEIDYWLRREKGDGICPSLTALEWAAHAGNASVARVLIDRGADVNHCGAWGTPLMSACKECPEVGQWLLAAGARIDEPMGEQGLTALHVMANFPHPRAVRWLIEQGADVNVKMRDGRTPLHRAAERNSGPAVAKMLVAAGAKVNARDRQGLTPLGYAVAKKKAKVADYLREAGGME